VGRISQEKVKIKEWERYLKEKNLRQGKIRNNGRNVTERIVTFISITQ
jgi:hypothetical protein